MMSPSHDQTRSHRAGGVDETTIAPARLLEPARAGSRLEMAVEDPP